MTPDTSQTNRAPDWLAPNILVAPPAPPKPCGQWVLWDGSVSSPTAEIEFSRATSFATPIAPATVRLPFFWNYWDPSKTLPVDNRSLPSPFPGYIPPALLPAAYRLLVDHYLATGYTVAGTIVTEGGAIPLGWRPTPAVDPINTKAILTFWTVGPYFINDAEESRDFYPFTPILKPTVYWQPAPGKPGFYQLTGLGASLGAKNA